MEVLTQDVLIEEAHEATAAIDDEETAAAVISRAQRAIAALGLLPDGWAVARDDSTRVDFGSLGTRTETIFRLLDGDGAELAVSRREWRPGGHVVRPGWQSSEYGPDESRGRAVLLLLAALDCEGRGS